MGMELGSEGVEGDECTEVGDVGFGVEIRGEKEVFLEPERICVVDWVAEEVGVGSGLR